MNGKTTKRDDDDELGMGARVGMGLVAYTCWKLVYFLGGLAQTNKEKTTGLDKITTRFLT